jgi:hypothetical protein
MPDVPSRVSDSARLLASLSITAERLNSASDELNSALKIIERQLVDLNLGIEAWVPLPPTREWLSSPMEGEPEEWRESQLGFYRAAEAWMLATRTTQYHQFGDYGGPMWEHSNVRPLLRSPRDLRLAAVPALSDLMQELHKQASEKLALVDDAKALAGGDEPAATTLFDVAIQKVKCIVSDRYFVVSRPTFLDRTGDVVTIDVMVDTISGPTRKICKLIVPKDELLRALSQPRVPDDEPNFPPDPADDETVN